MLRTIAASTIPGVFRELKRRHVFRVAVAYGAVAWMVLEVSSALFPALGIPDWSLSLLAMLLILGFPIAMVLAWAYDITPDGVQRTTHATPAAHAVPEMRVERRDRVPAIAALPFDVGGPAAEFQFLGDGIADELINALAQHSGLRVVARTSSFSFRGGAADVREIADRLSVGYVIEGSVRVTGERLRINARLVDAAVGYALWSGSYDRTMEDLLAVQEEVAQAVLGALPSAVGAPDAGSVLANSTEDVHAYTLYLRGRQLWNERTPAALRAGIARFEEAIRHDPGFAHAHAGLADSFAILVDYGILEPAVALPLARSAAERALRSGPALAEAHTSSALVRQLDGDWAEAERGLRYALTLNAAYSAARQRLALLLAWTGRHAAATQEIAAAMEIDPLSPILATARGWIDYHAGEPERAAASLLQVLREQPAFHTARVPLAMALLQLGRADRAVDTLDTYLAVSERTAAVAALHVHALARAGRPQEAQRRLSILRRLARYRYVPSYHLAVAHVGLDDHAEALVCLQEAAARREPQLVQLRSEPLLAPLRGHPAFDGLLVPAVPALTQGT